MTDEEETEPQEAVAPTVTTAVAMRRQQEVVPQSGNFLQWTDAEAALMEFAGLGKRIATASAGIIWNGAGRGVVEAFLGYVKRSGLDPFAKQVYCAEVGGKWTILGAVDGFRLVAERTGQYQGQTPKEWTYDGGQTWTTIPAPPKGMDAGTHPDAARVGVWRKGFRQPLMVTISWAEFGKTPTDAKGNIREKDNWNLRGAWMLGIRAETHALRIAFPHELSGIYTREDFDDQMDAGEFTVIDWKAKIESQTDKADLRKLYLEMKNADVFTPELLATFQVQVGKTTKDSDPPKKGAPGQTGEPAVDQPTAPPADEPADGEPAPPPEDEEPPAPVLIPAGATRPKPSQQEEDAAAWEREEAERFLRGEQP